MSAPMIAWVPVVNNFYKWLTTSISRGHKTITLPPVEIHDVETMPELRPRTLKHLLKANHINFSIFFHELEFHNHMPHLLCSAYLLGANAEQLHTIYNEESKELLPWEDPPANITDHDWRDYLGNAVYQRAFVDFFEDELALKHGYRWQEVTAEYLFEGKNPLINCVFAGLGHALIHLGYAYEFTSRELAMEALAMTACDYNHLHKYLDDTSYTRPSDIPSASPLGLLQQIHKDSRFSGLFKTGLGGDCEKLMDTHEDLILDYWNAWTLDDPINDFEASQEAAVFLLVATVEPENPTYDFFLVHVLTTSHAIRVLLPQIPAQFHMSLVRQWWLLTIIIYIGQMRPEIKPNLIGRPDLKTKDWKYVEDKAVTGKWATDSHFVKGVRAIKEASMTWGDEYKWYLMAAVKLVDEFDGWRGFAEPDSDEKK